MSITEVEQQQLLIGGEWAGAGSGDTFERSDPYTGEVASRAAAASREDAHAAADAAAAAFPEWAATPPSARRELLQKAAALLMERAPEIAASSPPRPAGPSAGGCSTARWPPGCYGGRRANHGGDRRGDPVGRARVDGSRGPAAGGRGLGDRALERPDHPRHARGCHPIGLRQHGDPEGVRDLPAHARRDRPCAGRRRAAAGRGEPGHALGGGRRRRRRRADRPPGGAPHQLHGLHAGGAAGRRERRAAPEEGAARAGRQGAADRAGGRGPRRDGGRGEIRRVHAPGADLHVDGADRGRPVGGRTWPLAWARRRRR